MKNPPLNIPGQNGHRQGGILIGGTKYTDNQLLLACLFAQLGVEILHGVAQCVEHQASPTVTIRSYRPHDVPADYPNFIQTTSDAAGVKGVSPVTPMGVIGAGAFPNWWVADIIKAVRADHARRQMAASALPSPENAPENDNESTRVIKIKDLPLPREGAPGGQ